MSISVFSPFALPTVFCSNSNLGFLTTFNADEYSYWTLLTAAERTAVKAEYAAAGISLCVSAFGSTEQPTTSGLNPVTLADTIAAAVRPLSVTYFLLPS